MSRAASNAPQSNMMPEKPAPPPKVSEVPDPNGMFGEFGWAFVPEALVPALEMHGAA